MSQSNGVLTPTQEAAGIEQGLALLLQQSAQTNRYLQQLTQEISVMNQWFSQGPIIHAARPQIYTSRCIEVGLTKTRSLSKWKLNFYVEGYTRPVCAYGRNGYQNLVQLLQGVFPEISDNHFSDELFTQRNRDWQKDGRESCYEESFIAPQQFWVDWYEKMGNNGRSYAYVDRVYPAQ